MHSKRDLICCCCYAYDQSKKDADTFMCHIFTSFSANAIIFIISCRLQPQREKWSKKRKNIENKNRKNRTSAHTFVTTTTHTLNISPINRSFCRDLIHPYLPQSVACLQHVAHRSTFIKGICMYVCMCVHFTPLSIILRINQSTISHFYHILRPHEYLRFVCHQREFLRSLLLYFFQRMLRYGKYLVLQ